MKSTLQIFTILIVFIASKQFAISDEPKDSTKHKKIEKEIIIKNSEEGEINSEEKIIILEDDENSVEFQKVLKENDIVLDSITKKKVIIIKDNPDYILGKEKIIIFKGTTEDEISDNVKSILKTNSIEITTLKDNNIIIIKDNPDYILGKEKVIIFEGDEDFLDEKDIFDKDGLDFEWENDDFKFTMKNDEYTSDKEKPFLLLEAGQSILTNTTFEERYPNMNFKDNSISILRLGYYKYKHYKESTLIKASSHDIFVSYASDNIYDFDELSNNIQTQNWGFGINWTEGYGNEFHKNFRIIFNHTNGMTWNRLALVDEKSISDTNFLHTFNRYNEKFKFGEQFQSKVEIVLFDIVNLNATYERRHIFPAYMFWYSALSGIIELASQSILDEFIDEVREFSPEITPIINFFLKSGLSYGLYELRRDNMNWPIETEAPFVMENFKVGFGLNF
jgi:hypothetical protein